MTTPLEETVARALCTNAKASSNYDPELAYKTSKFYWDNAARAAIAAMEAAGWKYVEPGWQVVPVEPLESGAIRIV
jgi:hypothetical protein